MKTKFTFLIALFLSLVYVGCEKDKPADPTTDPTPNPALQCDVQVDKDTVIQGGNVMFSWTSNSDSLLLTINENSHQTLSKIGSKVFVIQETSSFVFRFYKTDSTSVKTLTVIAVPPLPNPPTLIINAPDSTEYGTSVMIDIESDGNSINVIPNNLVGFNGMPGTFSTPALTESVIYHITASNEGGQTDTSIFLTVIPLPTRTDTLCMPPLGWVPDSCWISPSDIVQWTYQPPDQSMIYSYVYVFYANGLFEVYKLPDYVLVSSPTASWYFVGEDENDIFWPYEPKHIEKLEQNSFIYTFELVSGGITMFHKVKMKPFVE